jgi:hypothetical protein
MNTAERIIKPTKAQIFRTVFLYTGQGESTLLVIPTGTGIDDYQYVLVDSDRDREKNEIDLCRSSLTHIRTMTTLEELRMFMMKLVLKRYGTLITSPAENTKLNTPTLNM